MSGFISKAACRGRRPSQFAGFDGFERQGLIARLLKERGVARFIVAPSGYGKTAVAVEYAETVFSWVHTFFINCQSPCFLRDLDDDSIADACRNIDGQVRLVVFDSLPPLDAQRSERFSSEIDSLLASGCEVVVTCAPTSDTLGPLQADQVRLGSTDLLLDDDELDAARSHNERMEMPAENLSAAHRIPALVWGDNDTAPSTFLKRSFKEPMPADLLLAMASMYVLQKGTLEDLSTIGPIDLDLVEHMLSAYPHLCYDADQGCFDVPRVSIEDAASTLKCEMDSIVSRSAYETREDLVLAWADMLLGRHDNPARSCDVVRVLCQRPHRAPWVAKHAADLVRAGCFYPSVKLVQMVSMKSSESSAQSKTAVVALDAVCRMHLGDEAGAAMSAKRIAFDESAHRNLRVYCLVMITRLESGALRDRAAACLEDIASRSDRTTPPDCSQAAGLARAWRAARTNVDALAAEWFRLRMSGADDETLCLVASQLFGMIERRANAGGIESFANAGDDVVAAESYVRARMESLEGQRADYALVSAGLAMEGAHDKGVAYTAGPLSTATLLELKQEQYSLNRQRQQFRSDRSDTLVGARSEVRTAAIEAKHAVSVKRNVPVLEVAMFGRFEASIGGAELDQKAFQRQNVRTLMVLLAIHLGREVPRTVLMRRMWPEAPDDIARKSFYSAWSNLKKALTLSDGTCPYLQRSQHGCCLDKRYVQTDASRLEEIMCELQFNERRQRDWASIYIELDEKFGCELMPSETKNESVMRARDEYRNRLVDALVAATQNVVEEGKPDYGILFARMAVSLDPVREDAYAALMRAQVASGQTPSAILTYHTCRDILAEKLGIYPSPKTSEYFESLLK